VPRWSKGEAELIVHPFGYRDAARFWDITDPKLAVLVHSVVGGTPAYRRELWCEDTPADLADFDPWVIRTVLNPQTDPSLYHSVLRPSPRATTPPAESRAISAGNLTRSRIPCGSWRIPGC